jgi:hypothetical protein
MVMSRVVLDLHGARAREGVDIDALETFLNHFRTALREWSRADRGSIARKGGRPYAHEAASSAFRLVEFRTGSGIATLAPSVLEGRGDDLGFDDSGETVAVATLLGLFEAIEANERLPGPVVEALGSARKAIGDDGSFGIKVSGHRQLSRVVIDENRIKHLQPTQPEAPDVPVSVTGRLHLIEVDPPNRRVGVLAQDGIDWTCTYPDSLHSVVTTLVEQLVRIAGTGRRISAATGRLQIERLERIAEHAQDELFSIDTVPLPQIRAEQRINGPQGLGVFVDERWADDEGSRLFLEATLGTARRS